MLDMSQMEQHLQHFVREYDMHVCNNSQHICVCVCNHMYHTLTGATFVTAGVYTNTASTAAARHPRAAISITFISPLIP